METTIKFNVIEHTFESLTDELIKYEDRYGFSSTEMFSQYLTGTLNQSEYVDPWIGLFILWLGTHQVRRFACPNTGVEIP